MAAVVGIAAATALGLVYSVHDNQLRSAEAFAPTVSRTSSTIGIGASKDNTLYESSSGNISNGAGQFFFVGNTNNGSRRRGVIAFDIAGNVPTGSTITSATLRLHVSKTRVGSRTVDLHRLLADWGEGSSNVGGGGGGGASATTNDATWVHRFFNTIQWSSNGGDFSNTVSASKSVGGEGATYTWGSTAQMVADVQGWLDDPSTSFGWLLKGNEGTRSAKRFDTKENGTLSNRPALTVEFTIPSLPPPAPTLLAPASGDITNDPTPTFAWTQVTGHPSAITYTLEIATADQPATGNFSSLVFLKVAIPDDAVASGAQQVVRFTLPGSDVLSGGSYVWHVRAVDTGGKAGDFSEKFGLIVDTGPPGKPTLLAPPNRSVGTDRHSHLRLETGDRRRDLPHLRYRGSPRHHGLHRPSLYRGRYSR